MACGCVGHGIEVKHSYLDVLAPYVYTKAETPNPAITTSATAYAAFQRELRKWFGSILSDAVDDINLRTAPTTNAIAAEIENAIKRSATRVPSGLQQFLIRQAAAGYSMGGLLLPAMMRPEMPALQQVERTMQQQMLRLSNQGVVTARGTLKELLGDSLETGVTPTQLRQRVQDWAKQGGDQDRAVKWRAERIARTEASRALNQGQVAAWEDSGLKRMKWAIAPNPCEFCAAMKKQAHGIGQPFLSVGSTLKGTKGGQMNVDYDNVMTPPLHPNCRCTLLPIVSQH
tara:strand:+ start:11493 stop:12350 length:858 start_codon:yes stop_codon:yes gene_type:complete